MNVSRNTVYNWFVKGSEYLNKVLPILKVKLLDKELIDVDHLCCLAHARAKFKYALEQGKDEEAEYFIRNIGRKWYERRPDAEGAKLSEEFLGSTLPIHKRWQVLYRPLGFAAFIKRSD